MSLKIVLETGFETGTSIWFHLSYWKFMTGLYFRTHYY